MKVWIALSFIPVAEDVVCGKYRNGGKFESESYKLRESLQGLSKLEKALMKRWTHLTSDDTYVDKFYDNYYWNRNSNKKDYIYIS